MIPFLTYITFWKLYNNNCAYYGLNGCHEGTYFTIGWFVYPLILIVADKAANLDIVGLASLFFILQLIYAYILATILAYLLRAHHTVLTTINWLLLTITVLILLWLFKVYYLS